MTKLIYSVLLCHFIAAFAALGMPLFLPVVLPTLGASIDADWAGYCLSYPRFVLRWRHDFGAALPIAMVAAAHSCVRNLALQQGLRCAAADNLAMFVFGLIVQGTFGGTMASNSYLSSQIKEAKTLGKSLNKTQLSARLALIVAPIGLGWSLSETNPLNAYLWLCVLPLIAMGITLTLPADKPAEQNLEKPNSESQQEQPVAKKNAMHAIRWIFFAQFGFAFSMVVTFPYFSPFVQQYGITNHAWIGFVRTAAWRLSVAGRQNPRVVRWAESPSTAAHVVARVCIACRELCLAFDCVRNRTHCCENYLRHRDGVLLSRIASASCEQSGSQTQWQSIFSL